MKCFECEKEVKWIRYTQFAGEHLFCTEHALAEKDFGDNNGQVWCEILNRVNFENNSIGPRILFTRPFGKSNDYIRIDIKAGICSVKELETWINDAKDFYINRLHRIFKILQQYSVSEEGLSPESAEFELNVEKLQDAINMGDIDRQTVLDMQCMEKEGHIKNLGLFVKDFHPLKTVQFSFVGGLK